MNKIFQKLMTNKKIKMIFLLVIYCPILFFTNCTCGLVNSEEEFHCDPSTGNGPIIISINASRTSGVAPLSVFFDATGTRGLTNNCEFNNNAAYMDATFAWDFGDPASDHHLTNPILNLNRASGFVAAHVFENPGTYTVILTVTDAAGDTATQTIAITAIDFNTIPGFQTYYVASAANGGADSNPGTIGAPFLTPQYSLTGPHMQPNTRILFRRGDTFHTPHFWVWDYDGPVIIGSYGVGPLPIIYSDEANGAYGTFSLYTDDWRVMNLEVRSGGSSYDGSPRYPGGINFGADTTNNLKYRTIEHDLGQVPMGIGGTYNTVAECEFYNVNVGAYSSNVGSTNDGNAVIGNHLHDQSGDHVGHTFRLQGGSRFYFAHNTIGPNISNVGWDALTIRGNSEKIVVYKNRFEGWVQAIRPQNTNSSKEYQHHIIMDSNLLIGPNIVSGDRQTGMQIDAKDIVIRNNIIYNYGNGITISYDTVVRNSRRIKIYNNTFINNTASSVFTFISPDSLCSNFDFKNNLMLDVAGGNPSYTKFIDITNGSTFNGESDNNMFYGSSWGANPNLFNVATLASWRTATGNDLNSFILDPNLINTNYASGDFCKPNAGSQVIDKGEFTPNTLDYYGNLRDGFRDIGACEYN